MPTGFFPDKTAFFAIGNIDIKIDQLHGTAITAYQEKQLSVIVENMVGYNSFSYKEPFVNQFCHKITSFDVLGGWGGGREGGENNE